jgi:hypothetical protein
MRLLRADYCCAFFGWRWWGGLGLPVSFVTGLSTLLSAAHPHLTVGERFHNRQRKPAWQHFKSAILNSSSNNPSSSYTSGQAVWRFALSQRPISRLARALSASWKYGGSIREIPAVVATTPLNTSHSVGVCSGASRNS